MLDAGGMLTIRYRPTLVKQVAKMLRAHRERQRNGLGATGRIALGAMEGCAPGKRQRSRREQTDSATPIC